MFSVSFVLLVIAGVTTGQKEQKMSFSSPELSDEEMHSQHMPANLKCDACTAVAYQMGELLKKGEKSIGNKKMKESDYLDVFEKICHASTFEGYGIKQVDKVNRLSGKGVEADEIPGMLMGGGKWPNRLSTKCFEFIDELGEDDIYDRFHKKRSLKEYLCHKVTKDCFKPGGNESKKEL